MSETEHEKPAEVPSWAESGSGAGMPLPAGWISGTCGTDTDQGPVPEGAPEQD